MVYLSILVLASVAASEDITDQFSLLQQHTVTRTDREGLKGTFFQAEGDLKSVDGFVGGGSEDLGFCCNHFMNNPGIVFCNRFSTLDCGHGPHPPKWYCPATCSGETTTTTTTTQWVGGGNSNHRGCCAALLREHGGRAGLCMFGGSVSCGGFGFKNPSWYCPETCPPTTTTTTEPWVGGGNSDHPGCCALFVQKHGRMPFCSHGGLFSCNNQGFQKASWYCPETCGAAVQPTTRATTTVTTTATTTTTTPQQNHQEDPCPMDNNAKFPSKFMCHEKGVVDETLANARNTQMYDAVAKSVKDLFLGLSNACSNDNCPKTEFSACILRMAGHDFMDFDGSKGGSDGCVNFDDHDNKGLKPCLFKGENNQSLNMAYEKHATSVSLADFIAIAGEAVMAFERDTPVFGNKNLGLLFRDQFRWGRKTNHNCSTNVALPLPQESCLANKKTFIDALGLTWRETAALMGVHSLGRARLENSGFNGWWSDPESASVFNNNYYHSLAQKGWTPKQMPAKDGGKFQWIRSGAKSKSTGQDEMMLDTDMCLLYANKDDTDIKAKESGKCCAWLMPNAFDKLLKTKENGEPWPRAKFDAVDHEQNKDKGEWCGFGLGDSTSTLTGPHSSFGNIKAWCCDPFSGGKVGTNNVDCNAGSFDTKGGANGKAAKDVLEFAADEDAWIKVFVEAWNLATTRGMR